MSRPISATSLGRTLGRLIGASEGGALVEFGLILPVLLLTTFGAIEFTLAMFDYHRMGEAARRGARVAIINPPVAKLDNLPTLGTITCSKVTSSVSCGTGVTMLNAANFTAVVSAIQEVAPSVQAANVNVTYSWSEIGDLSTPGGIKPLVTVQLSNVNHQFAMLSFIPSLDHIVLPSFSTSVVANAYTP